MLGAVIYIGLCHAHAGLQFVATCVISCTISGNVLKGTPRDVKEPAELCRSETKIHETHNLKIPQHVFAVCAIVRVATEDLVETGVVEGVLLCGVKPDIVLLVFCDLEKVNDGRILYRIADSRAFRNARPRAVFHRAKQLSFGERLAELAIDLARKTHGVALTDALDHLIEEDPEKIVPAPCHKPLALFYKQLEAMGTHPCHRCKVVTGSILFFFLLLGRAYSNRLYHGSSVGLSISLISGSRGLTSAFSLSISFPVCLSPLFCAEVFVCQHGVRLELIRDMKRLLALLYKVMDFLRKHLDF